MKIMIGGFLGLILGLNLFKLSEKIINYKCNQLNKELPSEDIVSKKMKNIFIIIHTLLYILGFYFIPIPQSIFVAIFITLALVITLVDISIRIIPNESVLFLLTIGVIYRIVDGGIASLKGSLLGLLLITGLFLGCGLIVYFMRGTIGVGAGDLKLAMVIAITIGYPGVIYFLFGLAIALLGYLGIKIVSRTFIIGTSFAMGGQILVGFILALFYPYIAHLI